jgi:acetyl-CoA carboxylase biotin carboxyl carrier protein
MTVDEIKELIQVVNESGIAELEVQRGEDRVRIRRYVASVAQDYVLTSHAAAPPAPTFSASQPMTHLGGGTSAGPSPDTNSVFVKSPIVGTFYESSTPGSAPFVKVGDRVSPGQVLCIIESMKLMNEIEAEVSGIIASKLVENGRPVEYGESLFAVTPA